MGLQAELTLSQQIRNVRLETANRWVANPLSKQLLTQELTLNRQITIERAKLARDYYRSSGGQASLREELKVAREIQNAREVAEKGKLGALADKTAGLRQQAVGTFFSTTAMASPVMTERFQQAVNDLSAVVGRTLLPWLEKLTDGIRSVADWFVGISPEGKKLIGNFIGIGTAILVAIPVISRLSTAATMASAALTSLAGTAGVTGGGRGGLIGSFIGAGVGGVVGHAVGGDNGALIGAAAGGLAPSLLGGMSKKALLGLGGVGVAAYGINELTNGGVEKVIGSVGNGVNALFRNTIGRLFMTGDDVKRANRRDWLGEKEKYGSISDSEKSELNRLRGEDKNKPSSFGASGFKADFMEIGQAARDLQVKLLTTGMDPNERTADNTAKLVSLMERQVNQVEKKEENKPAPIPRSGRGTGE